MILTLLIGFLIGVGMVIYRGLYFGPWNAAFNTLAACIAASFVFYILLQILASLGGFFMKLFFIIVIACLILFGGREVWNTYNPDNPINMPASVSQKFRWLGL